MRLPLDKVVIINSHLKGYSRKQLKKAKNAIFTLYNCVKTQLLYVADDVNSPPFCVFEMSEKNFSRGWWSLNLESVILKKQ